MPPTAPPRLVLAAGEGDEIDELLPIAVPTLALAPAPPFDDTA